jgi:hypothetical protein
MGMSHEQARIWKGFLVLTAAADEVKMKEVLLLLIAMLSIYTPSLVFLTPHKKHNPYTPSSADPRHRTYSYHTYSTANPLSNASVNPD